MSTSVGIDSAPTTLEFYINSERLTVVLGRTCINNRLRTDFLCKAGKTRCPKAEQRSPKAIHVGNLGNLPQVSRPTASLPELMAPARSADPSPAGAMKPSLTNGAASFTTGATMPHISAVELPGDGLHGHFMSLLPPDQAQSLCGPETTGTPRLTPEKPSFLDLPVSRATLTAVQPRARCPYFSSQREASPLVGCLLSP